MTTLPIGDVDDVPRGLDVVVRTDHGHSSLWRWLTRDPDTSGLVTGAGAPPEEGHQGTFEVINAVLANALALSSLVVAIATWRAQRRADPPVVRIERNGVRVDVPDASPETIAAIAAALDIPEGDDPA
jgi:hypothetical protein